MGMLRNPVGAKKLIFAFSLTAMPLRVVIEI
jgi:hypothetical protein